MNSAQISTHLDLLEMAGTMLDKYDSNDLSAPGLLEVNACKIAFKCIQN